MQKKIRTLLKRAQLETILKFYKFLAVPALLYDSECWTLTKEQLQKSNPLKLGSWGQWRATEEHIKREIQTSDKI
jgi:hypothetical protein